MQSSFLYGDHVICINLDTYDCYAVSGKEIEDRCPDEIPYTIWLDMIKLNVARTYLISNNITKNELRSKYLEVAKITHPDTGGNDSTFINIRNTYKRLESYFA